MEFRKIDANLNRACEGIRVLEELSRFDLNNQILTENCRQLRHELRQILSGFHFSLLEARNSVEDVGSYVSQKRGDDRRQGVRDLVCANSKRLQEALRVIEESLKGEGFYTEGKKVEGLRFEAYTLEKKLMEFFRRRLPKGVYGITAEKFGGGKSNLQTVKEMIEAGIGVIQYREKYKSLREKAAEAKEIRKMTADAGVCLIVNDHPDLALMVDADGLHIGQDDWHPSDVRRIIGNQKILGLSTHNPQQAQEAMTLDIDYIGAGPLFATQTKDDVCAPVGLDYLEYVSQHSKLPYVAIGGIKLHNLDQVLRYPVEHIALVSEIVESKDMKFLVKQIEDKLKRVREEK